MFNERFIRESRVENLLRAYLYWMVNPDWVVTGEIQFDAYNGGTGEFLDLPSQVNTIAAPLAVRYFSPLGIFGLLRTTFVNQHVTRNARDPSDPTIASSLPEGNDSFVTFDGAIGYRFPQRRGILTLEVNNLFDDNFKFQDESYRQFSIEVPRSTYLPERSFVARLYMNF